MFDLHHMAKWPNFPHHEVHMELDGSLRWKIREELGARRAAEFDEEGAYQ
jgi:hypothetical protein